MDENSNGRTTPETAPAQPAATPSIEGNTEASAERVVLGVSAPLRTLATRGGMVDADDVLRIPADRYMAAAHRLVHEWSRIVPAAIAIHQSLAAGVEWPATLIPELLDVLLVHDHECLRARERVQAKQVAWEQTQQALRTRNVDQDREASTTHQIARPEETAHVLSGTGMAAPQAAVGREESGYSGVPQDREDRSESRGRDR
ncbi:MAG: hypothetical protein ACYDBH_04480 [Acidobacteriaceae bacterium]